ncbi:MAG TPA: YncE family protein [Candidatus Baltobacteraceae bacterium]|nr:YncE family protein [Candidatus Baltobacteraceae bacterium]
MLIPAAPPQAVPVYSGFDYVTVDPQRRRVYAAHGGSQRLLIADADSGKVIAQVRVGACHGVAVNPATGHVYVGIEDDAVDEVDPVALKVVRTVATSGAVDAIAFDPGTNRIYADEDDGTHLFVVDASTFTLVKTIVIPGHKPEYLAVDPATHEVYQNIDSDSEIAVIDPKTLAVSRTIPTPEIRHNHPLQYDARYRQIVVAGGGVMSAYAPDGRKIGETKAGSFDQCDLDPTQHVLACAGGGGVTRYRLQPSGPPQQIDETHVAPGVHTLAVDPVTHAVFAVWADRDGKGDFLEKLVPSP